jgi:hypothetical protein
VANVVRITVSFSKQANDGNYGSETARCELVLEAVHFGDQTLETLDGLHARQALAQARAYVHQELAQSPNYSVRRAVEERKLEEQTAGDEVEEIEGEDANELEDLPL